jgi:GxxExxY protein
VEYSQLTKEIIGCAYRVYNKMGFGFLESVYEKCLLIELNKAGINAEAQKPIKVYYDEKNVGEFIVDIIVNDIIILELKSVSRLVKAHEVQLVNYLVATGKPIGLLLNFGEKRVEVKRKVKELSRIKSSEIIKYNYKNNHDNLVNPVEIRKE